VLVAFVILSLVGTALFQLYGGALNNAGAADAYGRAALVAESALAEASMPPLREATSEGSVDDGRIRWTAKVSPYAPEGVSPELAAASEALPVRLWRIAVEVTFEGANGKPRTFALATTRIGAKEMQPQ
jgi:hypothetical protein